MLFARILEKTIKTGRLTLIDGNGRTHVFQGERPARPSRCAFTTAPCIGSS